MLSRGHVVGGRYEVEELVASGRTATVYRALDTQTRSVCAVKVYAPDFLTREAAETLCRDVLACAPIVRSPYVLDVIGAGVDPSTRGPFIATPLLAGETMQSRIHKYGPIDAEELATYASQLARALDQAHRAGAIHGALKPSNLFLAKDDAGRPLVRILDYGTARTLSRVSASAKDLATAAYRAPEQFVLTATPTALAASDVWALGLVAYEALTGFPAGQLWGVERAEDVLTRILQGPPPVRVRAGAQAACLPPDFDPWCGRCLQLDPAARWSSAGDALRALDALVAKLARPRTALGGRLKSFVVAPNVEPTRRANVPLTLEALEAIDPLRPKTAIGVKSFAPPSLDATNAAPETPDVPSPPRNRTGLVVVAVLVVLTAAASVLAIALR